MSIGVIKWFDNEKGFGVIGTPEEEEYFVHIKSFVSKSYDLSEGTVIIFTIAEDKKKNRQIAINCRKLEEPQDWNTILFYLDKIDLIKIEIEERVKDSRGRPYYRKNVLLVSLVDEAISQFIENRSSGEIIKVFTESINEELDSNLFILYCERIEKLINKFYSAEESSMILENVFNYFSNKLNDELLFEVWKQKKYRFVSYFSKDEFEIPEKVLYSNYLKIGIPELRRIIDFSYGKDFCINLIDDKFDKIDQYHTIDLINLFNLFEFDLVRNIEERRLRLNKILSENISNKLRSEAYTFGKIASYEDFENYKNLFLLVPNQLDQKYRDELRIEIFAIIAENCSDEFQTELWVNNFFEEPRFELISNYFLNSGSRNENRLVILSRLSLDKQLDLFKTYSSKYSYEETFMLIEDFVRKENSINDRFNLLEILNETAFWINKKCKELVVHFYNFVDKSCDEEKKVDLFLNGYLEYVPIELVGQYKSKLNEKNLRVLIQNFKGEYLSIKKVLEFKIYDNSFSNLNYLYDLALEFLTSETFAEFDKKVFETIEQKEYYKIWELGKARITPTFHIKQILSDKYDNYFIIQSWIKNNAITKEGIKDFMFSFLNNLETIDNRVDFHKVINHIKFLLQIKNLNKFIRMDASSFLDEDETNQLSFNIGFNTDENLTQIKNLSSPICNLVLWYLDVEEFLDFDQLKQKFIYFLPAEQIRITKKLLSLKAKDKFNLSIEMLNELTRFDKDLYKSFIEFNPELPIDITTDVIIKALLSYNKNDCFFVESELLSIILEGLSVNKTKRFMLLDYFEKCSGRKIAKFNWRRNGSISKVIFDEDKFYFSIMFEYDPDLVEAVKTLPGRKWHSELKIWGVPSKYKDEVLEFAIKHRFFLDFDGNNYTNNLHLAEFKRIESPKGITFCEGRQANKNDELFTRIFYWCKGEKCYERTEAIHNSEEWESYTLLDFLEIFGLNTDSEDNFGNIVLKGKYYEFVGFINRFNRFLEHLYCEECNEILYPSEHGWFTVNNVIRFHCINENCSKKGKQVYLNHCLNGKCQSIIDSRISNRCPNEVYICKDCGTCCSHAAFGRRIQGINVTDFIDNPKKEWAYNELMRKFNNKLGHLERSEYYCYKCGCEMIEIKHDVFQCLKCKVTYDATRFNFKRPHIDLKNKNNSTDNINGDVNKDELHSPF